MTVSDYVWEFLANKGVTHCYFLPGGGCMHLVDALARQDRIKPVAMHHEQACGWASQGHNILTNTLSSVVLVTTGPGGTNAVTPCAGAWIDETPMLFISGQVPRFMIREYWERQRGPQEVTITDIVEPITKECILSKDAMVWLPELYREATTHPRGPVWLDVPLDIQGVSIGTR